jgi:hypothetical protein
MKRGGGVEATPEKSFISTTVTSHIEQYIIQYQYTESTSVNRPLEDHLEGNYLIK